MNAPYLVAALSGGLREGVGHVTLVSDPDMIGGEAGRRLSMMVGIVRDSSASVVFGDDYVGIRNASAVQATSNRIAPEALLLCNVRTADISEPKRRDLVQILQARLDTLHELREDLPRRAQRTILASPTLDRWLLLDGLHKLAPHTVVEPPPEDRPRRRRAIAPLLGVAAFGVVLVAATVRFWPISSTPDPDERIASAATLPPPSGHAAQTAGEAPPDPREASRNEWHHAVSELVEARIDRAGKDDIAAIVTRIEEFERDLEDRRFWPAEEAGAGARRLRGLLDRLSERVWGDDAEFARVAANLPDRHAEVLAELERLDRSLRGQAELLGRFERVEALLSSLDPSGASADSAEEATIGTGRAQLSEALVRTVDVHLKTLVNLEDGFADSFDWLRAIGQAPGPYLARITGDSNRVRVEGLFRAVRSLKPLEASRINLVVVFVHDEFRSCRMEPDFSRSGKISHDQLKKMPTLEMTKGNPVLLEGGRASPSRSKYFEFDFPILGIDSQALLFVDRERDGSPFTLPGTRVVEALAKPEDEQLRLAATDPAQLPGFIVKNAQPVRLFKFFLRGSNEDIRKITSLNKYITISQEIRPPVAMSRDGHSEKPRIP